MAYDNINLEKGLYATGKSFTQALEELDPSENYKGTSLEGLDAYERQLKRFDIKVSGPESDTISKFFSTTSSAALFPEYITRSVNQGVANNNKIEKIVATTTQIDGLDYRSISTDEKSIANSMLMVPEGTMMSEFTITAKGKLTKLSKFGRMITASYEAIKFQKLDLFTITLKKIGESISGSEFGRAISVIADNENLRVFKSNNENVTYEELVKLWSEFSPYQMTSLIVSREDMAKLLIMPEFRDSTAGLDFHGTGNLITPFGAEIFCSDNVSEGTFVALDKNYALEKVQAGGIVTEYDKLIDRQIERATISSIVGFSPIYDDAAILYTNSDY